MKKTRTLMKVMNSGTIGRGNSNLVNEFIIVTAFFTKLSQNCSNRKLCQASKKPQGCLRAPT